MRLRVPLAIFALLSISPALAQQEMPARKAGLWEVRISSETRPGIAGQSMQQCIDAATDKAMNSPSGGMGTDRCTQKNLTRSGNTITVESECQGPRGTSATTAVITGDLSSAYNVKVRSSVGGQTTNMSLDAKYLGACKADQRPGDMIMANGMKINIRDMQRAMQGAMPPGIPKR